MARMTKSGGVVLNKKEAKALADLLSNGIAASTVNVLGLNKLECLLFVEYQDFIDPDKSIDRLIGGWKQLAEKDAK